MSKKDCFIIAPLSTPEEVRKAYSGDANHFVHVLKDLVVPAVKQAGFNAIEPIMEGSDVIHAKIIRNLEDAPLVLCDISSLNPNVMLELGIRTALNKPVCIIKDDVTLSERVPFDLSIINNHTYHSNPTWTLVNEIEKLAKHVKGSEKDEENALWKYFGLRLTAHAPEGKPGTDNRLDILLAEVAALRKEGKISRAAENPWGAASLQAIPSLANVPNIGYFSPVVSPTAASISPTGFSGIGNIDYLPMVISGLPPAILWMTTSGSSVGSVMLELYNKAQESGLGMRNIYFNSGVITITVEPKDLIHPAQTSLESLVSSHGLQLQVTLYAGI